ncbi:MAG: NUDIX domain-containing protein [Candidatus Pacearchaeota archaeon]
MKYRKAIFIVTYTKTKKGYEFLILKRKLHWRGWEFPKGGLNYFETKKKAVRRELKEETGLKPIKMKKFDFSGKYEYGKTLSDRPMYEGQTFHLFATEVKKPAKGRIRIDTKEHSDYEWVSLKKAIKKVKWENQKNSLKIIGNWLKKKPKN